VILLVALAGAVECDPSAAAVALQSAGSRTDYDCVVAAEEGASILQAELLKDPPAGRERLTRALAIWLLTRTDRPMDPEVVARLAPSDRRLLADGIRARRGRRSPAPDHAVVFEQFSWYQPIPTYTDALLRPIDKENLAIVDPLVKPPPPSSPPPPAEEAFKDPPTARLDAEGKPAPAEAGSATATPAATSPVQSLCGCSAAPGASFGAFLVWAGLALALRRR
jgi:hypothetical protein